MEKTSRNRAYVVYVTIMVLMIILAFYYRSMALFLVLMWLSLREFTKGSKVRELEKRCLKQPIATDHGSDINAVMAAIRDESVEYLAAFTLKGEKVAESTLLSPNKCTYIAKDWERMRFWGEDIVEVHNHPSGDNAFSAMDFRSFMQADFIQKAIVVTKHYNFTMEKRYRYHGDLRDEIEEYYKKMQRRYKWIAVFSEHVASVSASFATALEYDLKFRVKRIYRVPKFLRPASKTIMAKAAQHH